MSKQKISRKWLEELSISLINDEEFEKIINHYCFSNRRIEIIQLLKMGNSKQKFVEDYSSPRLSYRHIENIYYDAQVGNRIEMIL